MAVDSTPAYGPSRYLPSTSISDSTSTGRSILTAASAAAVRTILGIEDVSTLETQSVAHAKTVCGFAYQPQVWTAHSIQKYGSSGSSWPSVIASGSSTTAIDSAGEYGGGTLVTTSGLSGGNVQWIGLSNGLGVFASSMMPDLVRAQDKWHLEFDFRINSTPDAQTTFGTGWSDSGAGNQIFLGVDGSQSTAKYRLWRTGGSGVNSTVNIDTGRHRARMWANGTTPGTIFASIDGETPVSVASIAWGSAGGPYGVINNGTTLAAQNCTMWHAIYVFEGVA